MTPRQQEILDFIKWYFKNKGYSPSRKEIAQNFEFHETAALGHLEALERKGYIKLIPKISRGIVVLER